MEVNTVIIDDFLPFPDLVRDQATKLEYYDLEHNIPGKRSDAADGDYQQYFQSRISEILNVTIDEFIYDSFCFQLIYEGAESWIHKDQGADWAGVLYLTPDAPLDSGTGIYNDNDELITAIGNVYNRLVLYKGNLNHSSILPGFGNCPDTGRLTQVFFFKTTSNIGWDDIK